MTVCRTDDEGSVGAEWSIPTDATALDSLLRSDKRRIKLIALEAGAYGTALTRSLRKLGYRVSVFESRQVSKFLAIRQNKTDRNDAKGLADLARLGRGSVSEIRVRSPECQRIRSTLVTRQRLVRTRCALEATMRSLFRLNGGRLKRSTSAAVLRRNVCNELDCLRKTLKIDLTDDVEPLLALSCAARSHVERLNKTLTVNAEQNPACRRFLTIPGVGPICALAFYSAVEDPARFRRNADIGPYLGLVPTLRQSGHSTVRRPISKRGDVMTRTYLAQAAWQHLRSEDSALNAWAAKLSERAGAGRTRIAVARKLAVMMLAMWKTNENYDRYHGLKDTAEGQMETRP